MLRKVKVTILAIVVIVAGISVYGYLATRNNKSYPDVTTNNTVVNETVAENFSHYSNSTNLPTYNFNASSNFTFNGMHSDFTVRLVGVAPLFVDFSDPVPSVWVDFYTEITGNVSSNLHPSGILVNMSDFGPYDNTNVGWLLNQQYDSAFPPFSNVSTPTMSLSNPSFGTYSVLYNFKFVNQSSNSAHFKFGLTAWEQVMYYVSSPSGTYVGTHVQHITASILGLGKPVFVTLNITLQDTA